MAGQIHHQRGTSPGTPDEIVARVAARQYGVIKLAELLWAGLDHDAITRGVKCGRLHRLYHGVYAVTASR